MMGNLHNKYSLSNYVDAYRKKLIEEVDGLEITESTNLDALVERLKARYTILPIALKEPKPSEPQEAQQDVQDTFGRGTYKKKVFVINTTVAFEGNHELFDCSPSRSTIIWLDNGVKINTTSISIATVLDDLDPAKYKARIDKAIGELSTNLPTVHAEIAPWNNRLEGLIRELLEKRKGVVSKKFDFMEKIGLKVNPKSSDFMVPPTIAKKIIPKPVTETTKEVKKEIIPILQEDVYRDIKEVLYNVGKAIERKPSLYFERHEEDLRDMFLLFLETRYESASGVGEAFNKKGKTDILLKYAKDGSNLFVAECKFWKGQKKLHEGITQLLSYLTHRDSKTELILFVDQKEFSSVVTTVKDEIKNHPQFKKHVRDTYEHSINYEFALPDDSQKIIQIEVILFHYPAIK